MPLEAAALFFDLAGLGGPLWIATGWAIDQLLALAHWVAGMKGAVAALPTMPVAAFAAMAAGGLWLCLWNSRVRYAGLILVVLGGASALAAPVPDLLITGDGRHLALTDDQGRPAMLRDKSGDFMLSMMSENSGYDGDPGALSEAAGAQCSRDACVAEFERGGRTWRLLATRSGQRIDWAALIKACNSVDIAVSERWLPRSCNPHWLKLDRDTLNVTGGVAIYLKNVPRVVTVAERVGSHPWAQTGF